jgi:hypothetical protein
MLSVTKHVDNQENECVLLFVMLCKYMEGVRPWVLEG